MRTTNPEIEILRNGKLIKVPKGIMYYRDRYGNWVPRAWCLERLREQVKKVGKEKLLEMYPNDQSAIKNYVRDPQLGDESSVRE